MSILQRIFGKPRFDERDIDQLIFDLAEHGNRPADRRELYRRLPNMELFARVLTANFPLQNGSQHTIGPGQNLQIQSASLASGHNLAQFFIDRSDSRVGSHFISISPREACSMVLTMDALSGLLICNSKNSWVALQSVGLRCTAFVQPSMPEFSLDADANHRPDSTRGRPPEVADRNPPSAR